MLSVSLSYGYKKITMRRPPQVTVRRIIRPWGNYPFLRAGETGPPPEVATEMSPLSTFNEHAYETPIDQLAREIMPASNLPPPLPARGPNVARIAPAFLS